MDNVTKNQLQNALFSTTASGGMIRLREVDFIGIISIERESGSGHTFNVTGYDTEGCKRTVFVQTID